MKHSGLTTLTLCFALHLAFTKAGPVDDMAVNCGSSGNSTALDGREWIGDIGSSQEPKAISRTIHQLVSVDHVPYTTARLSRSQFTYTFQVSPGQKFLRLHFHPASYLGFEKSKAFFTVKAGRFTLLSNFSASLTADALGVKSFAKEFCVTVEENQALNITFSPYRSGTDIYAFINGIEIVSMPSGLYHTRGGDGDLGAPVIGKNYYRFYIDDSTPLELVHRLNVGGRSILSVEDSGMFRVWSEDRKYLVQSSGVVPVGTTSMIKYTNIRTYTAPLKVYQSTWSVGPNKHANHIYNFTWKLPLDLGFRYLVRLHFCEIEPSITENGHREFGIFINNQVAETCADVIKWSGGNRVAIYRDYVVMMEGDRMEAKGDLIIALQPKQTDAILNGLEVLKLSNPDNNLAGPNPASSATRTSTWIRSLRKLVLVFGIGNAIATGVILVLTLLNIIVYQLNFRGANSGESTISSPGEGEEVCRCFSLVEIQLATNNFDDELVIGKGGFGKVYKGLINNGTKTVAIKRLNSKSNQGAHEFWMEIETLSNIRHINLVSLIGYCDESPEMLLVYEYMAHGTLADHLYKNGNFPLSWEQRLNICIGAARGLDYLHTCKDGVIHRDVKSTNILLNENLVAKISDFGLSKTYNADPLRTHISTNVKGTFGYMDPEYFLTRRLTRKTDIYAFGVVLLEVLCGRPVVDASLEEEQISLTMWAQHCIKEGAHDQIIDPSLMGEISRHCLEEFAEIAIKCLHNHLNERPTMAQVVASLEFVLERTTYSYSEVSSVGDSCNRQIAEINIQSTRTNAEVVQSIATNSNSLALQELGIVLARFKIFRRVVCVTQRTKIFRQRFRNTGK